MAQYSAKQLEAIGGNRWQNEKYDRVYFNDLAALYGLNVNYYKTGNVSSASLNGESISNSKARKILSILNTGKLYYDLKLKTWGSKYIDSYLSDLISAIESKL